MCELQHDDDYLKRRDEGVQEFFFRELSVKERAVFWHARRAWFAQKGYTLFTFVEGDPIHAAPEQSSFKLASCKYGGLTAGGTNTFPYADFWVHSRTNGFTAGMHFYAQDSVGHHVALKFIPGQSQEFYVLRFLHQQRADNPEFCNSIIPVLELIPYETHWFVVMPRWGHFPYKQTIRNTSEILTDVECLLDALVFLHRNRIIHRDIQATNMLINHIYVRVEELNEDGSADPTHTENAPRTAALFDFNLAVILPSGQKRLPWRFGTMGWCYAAATDIGLGEYDYDPFAYDVYALGSVLMEYYSVFLPVIPMLAPLLAGMTFPDASRRLTAQQALQFYHDRRNDSELSTEEIQAPIPPSYMLYYKTNHEDPWEGLSEDFVRKWAMYRAVPPSIFTRVLRWLCRYDWVRAFVSSLRWAVRSCVPLSS